MVQSKDNVTEPWSPFCSVQSLRRRVNQRAVAVVGTVDSVGRRVLRLSTLSIVQEATICSLDSVPRCLTMFGPFHAVMQRRAADGASGLHRPEAKGLGMDDGAVEVEMC